MENRCPTSPIDLRVQAVASDDRRGIAYIVQDTGIGIDVDRCRTLFEPFVQADPSPTRRHGGTGLGLPICLSLVDLMGGHLSVHSEPGLGSTFTVWLPDD